MVGDQRLVAACVEDQLMAEALEIREPQARPVVLDVGSLGRQPVRPEIQRLL